MDYESVRVPDQTQNTLTKYTFSRLLYQVNFHMVNSAKWKFSQAN